MLQKNPDPLCRDYTEVLARMLEAGKTADSVNVDFREIVGVGSGIDRFTHLIHPYPAKLLPNIPIFLLNCSQLGKSGGSVYDPFCGSGTVLLEALIRGRDAHGSDTNPLARLITLAKTTVQSSERLGFCLQSILDSMPRHGSGLPAGAIELERWFSTSVLLQLDRLASAVRELPAGPTKTFMQVCFSATVMKSSLADPTVPVPVLINPNKKTLSRAQRKLRQEWFRERSAIKIFPLFESIATTNIARMMRLEQFLRKGCRVSSISKDAREASTEPLVDLIVSSPPYASAQKYIRASSISLQWLGLAKDGLRPLERSTIGREHYNKSELLESPAITSPSSVGVLEHLGNVNPLRRHIAANYLAEMSIALCQSSKRLRSGGHLILIVGNNVAAGQVFDTRTYLTEICERIGLTKVLVLEDQIRSRGLITKRHHSASVIAKEWVLIFRKP